jgi:hypothetical protein
VVTLTKGPDGRWLLPRTTGKGGQNGGSAAPLAVDLVVHRGIVRTAEPARFDTLAANIDATLRVHGAGTTWDFAVGRLATRLPGPKLTIARADGRARLSEDRLALDHFRVRTDAGWVEFAGGGRLGAAPNFDGDLKAGEWTWHALSLILRQPDLDVSGGFAATAHAHLDAAGLAFSRGNADVLWRGEPARVEFAGAWKDGRLTLNDSAVRWRASAYKGGFALEPRTGAWRLAGRVDGLELHDLPRLWPMSPLDSIAVSADVELGGDKHGLTGRVSRGSGRWRGQAVDSLTGTWALVAGTQTIAASARTAGGRVTAQGTLTAHTVDARVGAAGLVADRASGRLWRALGLDPAPAGRLESLDAKLTGSLQRPAVDGRARVTSFERAPVRVAHASVAFSGTLGPGYRVTANLTGGEAYAGPAHADTSVAQVVLSPDRVDVPHFRAVRAESVLVLKGFATRAGNAWNIRVDSLDWQAGERIHLHGDGPLELRAEASGGVDFDRARIVSTAGTLEARGRWGGEHAESDLTVQLGALDLEALLGPVAAEKEIAGVVTGTARLRGPPGKSVWDLDAAGTDLRYHARRAPHVRIQGHFADTAWDLQGVDLDTGQGRIHLAGKIDWQAPPPWSGSAEDWTHALTAAPHWEGTLSTDSLALGQISEFYPKAGGWRGALTLTANLSGRPAAPAFSAQGRLAAPGWGQASLGDFDLALDYHDDVLTVNRFAMQGPDSLGPAVRGTLPLKLGWGVPSAERLPDRPMELTLFAHQLDLGLAPLILPQIAAAVGRVNLNVHITGTPKHPYASGSLVVKDGTVRPANREEVLTAVTGTVALAGEELRVESFEARQGKRGRIVVKPGGVAHLKDLRIADYAFSLAATNVTAFSSGEYVLEMNGDFDVKNGADLGGPLPIPHITGKATVLEGVFLTNFGDADQQAASFGPAELPPWTYDVQVEARNNVWWRPPDANIEGRLTEFEVVQSLDRFLLLGQVDAVRGRYYFLGNQFDVKSGTLFFDAANPLNPTVDATLTTEKSAQGPPAQGQSGSSGSRETITLAVSGRALTPNVTLSSEPNQWSPTEIATVLTYGQFTGGKGQIGQAAGAYLLNQLLRDPGVASVLGGFEVATTGETQLEPGQTSLVVPGSGETSAKAYTRLGMSRYLTRDLLVRYSQIVGDVSGLNAPQRVDYQDLAAEYRLNRLLFLQGQVTRRRGIAVAQDETGTVYNLDLRARFEY